MDKELVVNTGNEEQMDENCQLCGLHFINLVPATSDADCPCTAAVCNSGDRLVEVKQEHLPAIKQEAVDVCYST